MARLCAGGIRLRNQTNYHFKRRDKRSDGWIGDKAHASRKSDHNPDSKGIVHALDIDADLYGQFGGLRGRKAAQELADNLIKYARSGAPGSDRLKYVVFDNRIASGTYSKTFWTWRKGNWGHEHHIHVSFTSKADRDGSKFPAWVFDV